MYYCKIKTVIRGVLLHSTTLHGKYFLFQGRPVSVRVQLAGKENLSEVPTLPIREDTDL